MANSCSNCRYARPKGQKYTCNKFAPRPQIAEENVDAKPKAVWPIVRADDWCAEWNVNHA